MHLTYNGFTLPLWVGYVIKETKVEAKPAADEVIVTITLQLPPAPLPQTENL